jgi:glucosylglycerate phosphorylase
MIGGIVMTPEDARGCNAITDGYKILYNREPDYHRPQLNISDKLRKRLTDRLRFLYGEEKALRYLPELERVMKVHYAHKPPELIEFEKELDPGEQFTEKDMLLITYGDIVHGEGRSPLDTLSKFVDKYNRGAVNGLHILPFFPYSSDRGFAVVDFKSVNPALGTWEDIHNIGCRYKLMFDGVLNHVSSKSKIFRQYLDGDPEVQDFFISYTTPDELTPDQRNKIFRPRTSDILTRYDTINGPRWVWTTFSEDQIDFNYRNPKVLISVLEGLLFYIRNGADMLRLDAVTYIWAEPGTECVHMPEAHEIIKLLRDVIDAVAPGVALITETNVPHRDNISYFGDGYDEAHMVYNFALPPLVLHTFYTGNASDLSKWAQSLTTPSDATAFFNILDTHDGIGLMAVQDILRKEDIEFIVERAQKHGALVSFKMGRNRNQEPYEINSTWWSAINGDDCGEDIALQVKRFVASRSIALVLKGVPGVYAHGVIGTANDHELAKKTQHNRDVNRGIIESADAAKQLHEPESKLSLIGRDLPKINLARTNQKAFHPRGQQRILLISPDVLAVLRISPDEKQRIVAITNVTSRETVVEIPAPDLGVGENHWYDLVGDKEWVVESDSLKIFLQPYDVVWLKSSNEVRKDHVEDAHQLN